MAEETGNEGSAMLGQVLDTIQNYKQNDSGKGQAGWIAALVAGVLALIAIAILAWQAWQAGKAKARAQHELAIAEEDAHQAEVNADLAEHQVTKETALEWAAAARAEAEKLDQQVQELEAERVRAHSLIDKITSWEDVDAIVR